MINTISETHSKLPPRYALALYDHVPKNIKNVLQVMRDEGRGLYLWGDCGTGKTHIAYSIMARCIERKIPAKLYNSPELLDVIRDFYGRKGLDYRDNDLKILMDYEGLLVIDDIGAEKPTDWVAETFYKIINRRYEKSLPTIFTSNFSLGELAEKIGDRVPSRISEMCEVIKLAGDDRRLN